MVSKFVRAEIMAEPVWDALRSQSLLGRDDFVDSLKDYLSDRKEMKEIPRSQRYLDRPGLDTIFTADLQSIKGNRDRRIVESVEKYGYSQKEVADHLGLHYSTVCRIVNER